MALHPSTEDCFQSCLLGLAIGDALGMPFEGLPSWVVGPVLDRIQGFHESGHRELGAGQWTDDTQMTLCLVRSLVRCGRLDPEDVAREYLGWFQSGDVRGIGGTTKSAMARLEAGAGWHESGTAGEYAAGNGTAMRAAPLGREVDWRVHLGEGLDPRDPRLSEAVSRALALLREQTGV